MRIARPPQRHAPETIIALIDVVFFLLVFFMLIGRMDATAPFEVDPPVALTGADMPAGGVTISVSETGALAEDGVQIAPEEIVARVQTILGSQPDTLLRINAHRNTALREVLPLVASFEAMGAQDIVLVVTPSGDAR